MRSTQRDRQTSCQESSQCFAKNGITWTIDITTRRIFTKICFVRNNPTASQLGVVVPIRVQKRLFEESDQQFNSQLNGDRVELD
jgi:hypothetical protein